MKNLYFTKTLLIFLMVWTLESPSVAMDDDIDTEKRYRIIGKAGDILCPYDLRTRPFREDGNLKDFCFEFIRNGANSYKIKGITGNVKKSRVLNVMNAFGSYGDKSVRLAPNDGTWKRHRSFLAEMININDETYHRFINKESKTILGIDTNTGRIKAFYCPSMDSQEDNKLFKIEPVEELLEDLPLITLPRMEKWIDDTKKAANETIKDALRPIPIVNWFVPK